MNDVKHVDKLTNARIQFEGINGEVVKVPFELTPEVKDIIRQWYRPDGRLRLDLWLLPDDRYENKAVVQVKMYSADRGYESMVDAG